MPLLLFILLVAVEIALLVGLVDALGIVPVILWIVCSGVFGVWLIRRTGLNTLARLQQAQGQGELPAAAVFADLLLLAAGLMFLLPGLLFDLVGFALLLGAGLRHRLASRLQRGMAQRHPELRRPVTLEGEYTELRR